MAGRFAGNPTGCVERARLGLGVPGRRRLHLGRISWDAGLIAKGARSMAGSVHIDLPMRTVRYPQKKRRDACGLLAKCRLPMRCRREGGALAPLFDACSFHGANEEICPRALPGKGYCGIVYSRERPNVFFTALQVRPTLLSYPPSHISANACPDFARCKFLYVRMFSCFPENEAYAAAGQA